MALEKDLLRSIKDQCPEHCRSCNYAFISCKNQSFGCSKTQELCPEDPLDCPVMENLPGLCKKCDSLLICCFDGDAELPPDNQMTDECHKALEKYQDLLRNDSDTNDLYHDEDACNKMP